MDWTQVTWRPGVGDPTLAGWVVTVSLGLAALMSLAAIFKAYPNRRVAAFWIVGTLMLTILAVNKQLDFHVFLIQVGRAMSRVQGWYSLRRQAQLALVIVLGLALLTLIVFGLLPLRRWWRYIAWAAGGLICTLVVTLYRAICLCHGLPMLNPQVFAVFELIGPFWVMAGTLRFLLSDPIHRHF